jgi:hypothetical protein
MSYQEPQSFEPQGPRQNAWGALVRVITEPAATFRDFAGRVPIFPGYLASMVLGLAGSLMALPVALKVAEQLTSANPAMTPELANISRWSGIIGAVVAALAGPWIGGLLVSLFAIFFGQFQEQRVSYVTYLGMVGYARVPLAIGQVVTGALTLALAGKVKGLTLSLAILAPNGAGASPVVKTLLGMVTPFSIWYFALLAIGFGALHRGKASRGLGLVLTIFVILAIVMAASAAVGSKLTGQMMPR